MLFELGRCIADLRKLIRIYIEQLERQADASTESTLANRIDAGLKLVTRLAITTLASAVTLVLSVMIYNAILSHSVVVEAFSVPKILAEHGFSKEFVAETILDALKRNQALTRVESAKLRLTEAWNEPLKLEIPKANISVSDVRDALHQIFSQDIHVNGELIQLPSGDFQLVIRGDGIPAHQFSFKEGEFSNCAMKAAEYVYGTAEPVAFATYLLQQFRTSDGLDFLSRAVVTAPSEFRPVLAALFAKFNAYSGNFVRAVELDRLSLKLDPYYWPAWEELAQDKRLLEGPESEVTTFQEMHAAALRAPEAKKPKPINFRLEYNLLHDWSGEIQALQEDQAKVTSGTEATSAWFGLAMAELQRHGYESAQRYVDEADPDDPQLDAHLHTIRSGLAPQTDQNTTLHERETADQSNWKNEAYRNMIPNGPCDLAISYAAGNRRKEALYTLDRVQKQNSKVGCEGDDGITFELLGDRVEADNAFSRAIASEPSLPDPFEHRGEMLMRRKDWSGAASDFDKAHQRAPHWADPLKYWGDTLKEQGNIKEALDKYESALACAPEWAELLVAIRSISEGKETLGGTSMIATRDGHPLACGE
jgi:tetratricopeptide (TPR) repeat protein